MNHPLISSLLSDFMCVCGERNSPVLMQSPPVSNNVCYRAPRGRSESSKYKHQVGKDVEQKCKVQPVHCSIIWPSAWMEGLNILTLDMTERTCWIHSGGSAARQGGFCLCDISVLKHPVVVPPKMFFHSCQPL